MYKSRRWRRMSRAFLDKHLYCRACLAQGIKTIAEECDHIEPHQGNAELFWDQTNWQPLCSSCHAQKTYRDTLARRRTLDR